LEHRFYGASQPFADLSTDNLAYLNSQQALADAANFIAFIQRYSFISFLVLLVLEGFNVVSSQYPNAGPTISFGGSYPGALSAWYTTFSFFFLIFILISSLGSVSSTPISLRPRSPHLRPSLPSST
jgi:hypothetical protein